MTTRTEARDEHVAVSDLRFHFREWGDPDAPAVLLLHGLTGNAWEWDPIAARLSRRFRVLAIDQRGHGASAHASDYAAERMVEDLGRIVLALAPDAPAIVGHSMGGLTAYLFAARRPELARRLVIVDFGPDSMSAPMSAAWKASLRASAEASYGDPEEAVAEWRSANPRARQRELRHFIAHNLLEGGDGRWRWRFDAAGFDSFLDHAPGQAAQWAALRRVSCPTLVVRGEHSPIVSRRTAARMAREAPADSVEIPGGGHDLTVEQPGALTEAVDGFLEPGDRRRPSS